MDFNQFILRKGGLSADLRHPGFTRVLPVLIEHTVAAHSPDNFQKCCYLQVACTTTETKDLSQNGRKRVRSKVYAWLDIVCSATVAT